jgi:hypothetical protein
MLYLVSKPWNNSKKCEICNLGAEENVLHFILVCPTLKSYRNKYLKKYSLTKEEVICILDNWEHWPGVAMYVEDALNYRKILLEEINF